MDGLTMRDIVTITGLKYQNNTDSNLMINFFNTLQHNKQGCPSISNL